MTDQIAHSSFSKASSVIVAARLNATPLLNVARLRRPKDHACNSVSCLRSPVSGVMCRVSYLLRLYPGFARIRYCMYLRKSVHVWCMYSAYVMCGVVCDFLRKAWHSTCTQFHSHPHSIPCPMPHVPESTSMFANPTEGATPVREPRSYLLRLYY